MAAGSPTIRMSDRHPSAAAGALAQALADQVLELQDENRYLRGLLWRERQEKQRAEAQVVGTELRARSRIAHAERVATRALAELRRVRTSRWRRRRGSSSPT